MLSSVWYENTGALNVNVVGLEASADVNTSSACLTTLENGKTVCVGVPFSTVLISIATGISKSFCWKNRSILVRYTPPLGSHPESRMFVLMGQTIEFCSE